MAITHWYDLMCGKKIITDTTHVENMFELLYQERPNLLSVVMERGCNLQCQHCIFQREMSSSVISQERNVIKIVEHMITQLPTIHDGPRYLPPVMIHEGRILRDWHIPLLVSARTLRPDLKIGMIDNGTFVHYLDDIKKNDFKFDWLDISIDGTKEIHNFQRNNTRAYDIAFEGIRRAREVSRKVTSLCTLSSINYFTPHMIADELLGPAHVDELHFTTVSPVRRDIAHTEISREYVTGDVHEFEIMWEQMKKIHHIYNRNGATKVFFRFYQYQDIIKLAQVVGAKKFIESFCDRQNVKYSVGVISFVVDGVRVYYIPTSISPSETFVIDADGSYRLAYCLKYTLKELQSGISAQGEDIHAYTVDVLNMSSDHRTSYTQGVSQWVSAFGKEYLHKEYAAFRSIRNSTV